MQNLAGDKNADLIIRRELKRCGVPVLETNEVSGEVPYTIKGKLGPFSFTRAWSYYVVEGKVPLRVAEMLYEDEVGRSDIRACGNCLCISPGLQATWEDKQGKLLLKDSEINNYIVKSETSALYRDFWDRNKDRYASLDKTVEGDRIGYVDLYHIDSELGMYIFVQTLKRENII